MKSKIIALVLVGVTLSIGAYYVNAGGGNVNYDNQVTRDVNAGSVTGPDQFAPDGCFSYNGVRNCYTNVVATTASTTACRILTPAATSTLVRSSFSVNTATSTALSVAIAKTTTNNSTTASSTVLASGTLAASVKGAWVYASSTAVTNLGEGNITGGNVIFGPSTFLTWTVTGGASGVNTDVGTGDRIAAGVCTSMFQQI